MQNTLYSCAVKFVSPLAGHTTQLSYTQKRTVKHISIRCGSYGYSAKIHALRLCSHVRFCVHNGHIRSLAYIGFFNVLIYVYQLYRVDSRQTSCLEQ